MIRRPPRSTLSSSSAASDVYKRQVSTQSTGVFALPGWKTSQHRMGLLDKIKSNLKERTDNLRERIHTTRRKFSSNKNQESADECPSDETGLTAADSDSDSDDLSDVSPSTRASQYGAPPAHPNLTQRPPLLLQSSAGSRCGRSGRAAFEPWTSPEGDRRGCGRRRWHRDNAIRSKENDCAHGQETA
eukprot:TRINITY_DN9333_c0_g1_i4.p1 TRINITY_DN9333_c0_g1~~TRINITY_DN9333_c0_g1_i4.p1  ORF type:complete len:187 (-),score=29.65 TRINITY_DN9333_c0_g1_i4:664-1224(-)